MASSATPRPETYAPPAASAAAPAAGPASPGDRAAGEACQRYGALPWGAMQPRLAFGVYVRPLPEPLPDGARRVDAMLKYGAGASLPLLDAEPEVRTAVGTIPVRAAPRDALLTRLAASNPGRDSPGGLLLRAAGTLFPHLQLAESRWLARRERVWRSAWRAERMAVDLLTTYLGANLALVREARGKFPRAGPAIDAPDLHDESYRALLPALVRVVTARRKARLTLLRTQVAVRQMVATAAVVCAYAEKHLASAVGAEESAAMWDRLAESFGVEDPAVRALAAATHEYLSVLRAEAVKEPILLIIQHAALETHGDVWRAIRDAVADAESAIARLAEVNATRPIVGAALPDDPRVDALASRVAGATVHSVWQLPFFMEGAINELPPDEARDMRNLLQLAAEEAEAKGFRQMIAFMGVDGASMLAPIAGWVGIAFSVLWGMLNLGKSIQEYRALATLYRASVDPQLLLRGEAHDMPSDVGILMDVVGLIP